MSLASAFTAVHPERQPPRVKLEPDQLGDVRYFAIVAVCYRSLLSFALSETPLVLF
jgi:hypothetical protein